MEAPWARIAVNFYRHPRTRRLSKDAQHLYLASILHCVEFSTDGRFPADETPYLASVSCVRSSLESELLDAGLWTRQGDDVVIRDFLQHQTSRAELEARSERNRKAADARWSKAKSQSDNDVDAPRNATGSAECNASREEESRREKKPSDPPGFADFWTLWPRGEGRKAAVRAFPKAVRAVGSADELLELASRWLSDRSGMAPSFVPHASTWLNQERWDDAPPPAAKPSEQAVY